MRLNAAVTFFFFFFFAFHFSGKKFVPPTFRRRATPLYDEKPTATQAKFIGAANEIIALRL